jgi:hypothetical protein
MIHRNVFQIIGRFTYGAKFLELPIGQTNSLEEARLQIPAICDVYKNEKRGSDTFYSTFFIREVWTDAPWSTPYRINYIEDILRRK